MEILAKLYDQTRLWMAHPDECWVGVVLVSRTDNVTVVQNEETGELLELSASSPQTAPRNPTELEGADDLIKLQYLDEPNILFSLKQRYSEDKIYTFTGPILISVNPWKVLPLYDRPTLDRYKGTFLGDMPPHIFAIVESSYRSMIRDRKDQSILISGESGAGKTEATKVVMQYLAVVSGSRKLGLSTEQRLLETNPLLEAFGNAKTLRNDNSSRFGKFIEINFDGGGNIDGAFIQTYLLEKSRVVHQSPGERNYHIFYQLCAGASQEERVRWNLADPASFAYLSSGNCLVVPSIPDTELFMCCKQAMCYIGLTSEEQEHFFATLSAVLHLGAISFSPDASGEGTHVVEDDLIICSSLLGVAPSRLQSAFCSRKMEVSDEVVIVLHNATQAMDSRDALAKGLYSRLFNKLVSRINELLSETQSATTAGCSKIGVLDIFGFEMFQVNRFEQFCINYANEKLQQQFNQFVFKIEQQEYKREKIQWSELDFVDNQKCLDLIEERPNGVLSLLDEQCIFPMGNDSGFVTKVRGQQKENSYFLTPKHSLCCFGIRHYAGEVMYDCEGFCDKNRDSLAQDLVALMLSSSSTFTCSLFANDNNFAADDRTPGSSRSDPKKRRTRGSTIVFESLTAQFKSQLSLLMKTINNTMPHYVRCVNPNERKAANFFNKANVLDQLRSGGVMEAVRVTRAGFPTRFLHRDFVARYGILSSRTNRVVSPDLQQLCKALLASLPISQDQYQIGLTKVFFRHTLGEQMERLRCDRIESFVVSIQKNVRMFITRNRYRAIRRYVVEVQRVLRGFLGRCHYRLFESERRASQLQAFVRRVLVFRTYSSRKLHCCHLQNALRATVARHRLAANLEAFRLQEEADRKRALTDEAKEAKRKEQAALAQKAIDDRRIAAEKAAADKARSDAVAAIVASTPPATASVPSPTSTSTSAAISNAELDKIRQENERLQKQLEAQVYDNRVLQKQLKAVPATNMDATPEKRGRPAASSPGRESPTAVVLTARKVYDNIIAELKSTCEAQKAALTAAETANTDLVKQLQLSKLQNQQLQTQNAQLQKQLSQRTTMPEESYSFTEALKSHSQLLAFLQDVVVKQAPDLERMETALRARVAHLLSRPGDSIAVQLETDEDIKTLYGGLRGVAALQRSQDANVCLSLVSDKLQLLRTSYDDSEMVNATEAQLMMDLANQQNAELERQLKTKQAELDRLKSELAARPDEGEYLTLQAQLGDLKAKTVAQADAVHAAELRAQALLHARDELAAAAEAREADALVWQRSSEALERRAEEARALERASHHRLMAKLAEVRSLSDLTALLVQQETLKALYEAAVSKEDSDGSTPLPMTAAHLQIAMWFVDCKMEFQNLFHGSEQQSLKLRQLQLREAEGRSQMHQVEESTKRYEALLADLHSKMEVEKQTNASLAREVTRLRDVLSKADARKAAQRKSLEALIAFVKETGQGSSIEHLQSRKVAIRTDLATARIALKQSEWAVPGTTREDEAEIEQARYDCACTVEDLEARVTLLDFQIDQGTRLHDLEARLKDTKQVVKVPLISPSKKLIDGDANAPEVNMEQYLALRESFKAENINKTEMLKCLNDIRKLHTIADLQNRAEYLGIKLESARELRSERQKKEQKLEGMQLQQLRDQHAGRLADLKRKLERQSTQAALEMEQFITDFDRVDSVEVVQACYQLVESIIQRERVVSDLQRKSTLRNERDVLEALLAENADIAVGHAARAGAAGLGGDGDEFENHAPPAQHTTPRRVPPSHTTTPRATAGRGPEDVQVLDLLMQLDHERSEKHHLQVKLDSVTQQFQRCQMLVKRIIRTRTNAQFQEVQMDSKVSGFNSQLDKDVFAEASQWDSLHELATSARR